MEATSLDSLERDFQEVLAELVGDKSLERFRQEYEKLHRALKKSHESEKRLIKKCRELNQEIVANAAKVQTALKLSQEDQNTIASLKREIEKAWKMVDAAHEKEGRAKETITQLKTEIQNLSRLVEQGAGLSIGQENTVNELVKVKGELAKEREAQATQIASLMHEIQQYLSKIGAIEGEIEQLKQNMAQLQNGVKRYHTSGRAIEALKDETGGKEMLVPLTSSLYVPGILGDTDTILLDIGTGYFVEKSPEDGVDYCKRKVNMVRENMEKLLEFIQQKQNQAAQVNQVFNAKVMQMQEQQKIAEAQGV